MRHKKAFTLVELIVVITILAILGTIAFISLQGYSRNARDSARISDASSITTSLEVFVTTSGFYPKPEDGFDISYSGAMVWHQGIFSDNVVTNLRSLSEVPVDPLTGAHYTYSRLNTKKEFELGLMLEVGGLAQISITGQATAASKVGQAYIKGNYNGIVAKVTLGSTLYMLAVPSIINGSIGAASYEDIIGDLVFNGGTNAPSSYDGTDYGTSSGVSDTIEFTPSSGIVIYSGSTILTSGDIITIVEGIQTSYSGSGLGNDGEIYPYLAGNATTNTGWAQYVGEIFVHENINSTYGVNADPVSPEGEVILAGWRALDPNCDIEDIPLIGLQVWAGCNSTLGDGVEWGKQDNGTDGLIGSCYDYSGNNTGDCTIGSANMASNIKASSWYTGTNINGDTEVDNIWGKLYTWSNAASACGVGYHVPTDAEWELLETILYGSNCRNALDGWRCNQLGWQGHDFVINTNNVSLSGIREVDGLTFNYRGSRTYLWSSTDSGTGAYGRYLDWNDARTYRETWDKDLGFSVRCIKD